MSGSTTPLSWLEAINLMLATINQAPVSALVGNLTVEVSDAQTTLDKVNRAVQVGDWRWNTDASQTLTPDTNGFISVTSNVIRVRLDERYWTQFDVVLRGTQLYDRRNNTYVFPSPINVYLTYLLPWEQLPEAARWYIAVRAARQFADHTLGAENIGKFTREDEEQALAILKNDDAVASDHNYLDNQDFTATFLRP